MRIRRCPVSEESTPRTGTWKCEQVICTRIFMAAWFVIKNKFGNNVNVPLQDE